MSENFYLDVSLLAVAVGVYATSLKSTNTIIAILLVIFVHQALVKKRLEQREQALQDESRSVGTPVLSTLDASQRVSIPEPGAAFDAPASFQRSYPAAGPDFVKTSTADTSTADTSTASASSVAITDTSASTTSNAATAQVTYNQPDTRPEPSPEFGPPPGPPPGPTGSSGPVGAHGYHATISDDIVSRNFQSARPSGTQASSMASFYKTMVAGL